MTINSSYIYPVICFAAFVLWLLSVAMDGPLLSAINIANATDVFLPVHIISLLLIGLFCPYRFFVRLIPVGCVLTGVLTPALVLANPVFKPGILMILGATGAVVAVSACISLRQSSAPLLCGASGLVIANFLFLPVSIQSQGVFWQFLLVAGPLLAIPVLTRRLPEITPHPVRENLWHYLLFILVFQVISGLMYIFMMPAYDQFALLPGGELLFYVAAVISCYWIVQKNRDLALVCGVILAMAAFTFLLSGNLPLPVNIGMFAMQAAAGFVDLVLIAILLALPSPIRAFGIGLALMCAGILGGKIVGQYFADMTEPIVMSGHLVLNISIITLYFLGRYNDIARVRGKRIPPAPDTKPGLAVTEYKSTPAPDAFPAALQPPLPAPDNDHAASHLLPDYLRLLLSAREFRVLEKVTAGRTYRETAQELKISESTVKTYMLRIYEKMEVKGKKGLFERLNRL